MLLAEGAMVVSIAALAVALWQWRSTRAPVESVNRRADTAETSAQLCAQAAAASARSAEQSAQAARAAAEAARDTAESAKRAWVHATEFRLALKSQLRVVSDAIADEAAVSPVRLTVRLLART